MQTFSDVLKAVRIRFQPASFLLFREKSSVSSRINDLLAGLIVGVVAIPLAIAFGIASGVSPTQGLVTAVIAGFLISAFSGSRVQIGGPTGAFIVIIYGIVHKYGYDGLAVATLMAGALLIVMGVCGFGSIIKFIPYPVTIGFTSGIALIIFVGQFKDLLGLDIANVPAEFVEKMQTYARHIGSVNGYSLLISTATVCICVFWRRVTAKIPGSLVAIVVTTLSVFALRRLGWLDPTAVSTIGDLFPDVARGMTIPAPHVPTVSFATFRELVSPAVSIALLAGIESLLSAVVADGMTGRRHNSNTELIGQGIANLCSPLFGGIPATGAIARTATNIKSGGTTPLAGIAHALFLLLVMLFLGRLAAWIPMATLGGIVVVVAYNMSEWRHFVKMFRSTRSDAAVMLATFLLTVFVDLTVAIQIGFLLAAALFIYRISETTQAGYITQMLGQQNPDNAGDDPLSICTRTIPPGVEVFEIEGALLFGAADKFKDALTQAGVHPNVLILRMRHVLALDATALHALEDVYAQTRREGIALVLSGVHSQPLFVMQRAGFLAVVGEANVYGNIDEAVARARALIEQQGVRGKHAR